MMPSADREEVEKWLPSKESGELASMLVSGSGSAGSGFMALSLDPESGSSCG